MFYKALLLLTTAILTQNPLSVSWEKKHSQFPKIQGYNYYYGDMSWGRVYYLGREDVLGMESEIHLYFNRNKITKADLVLGPAGINERNCIAKYKEVTKILTYKYGKFSYIKEKKDPIIEDLLSSHPCYPILIGTHEIDTYWENKDFLITLSLFGDEENIYLEVSYLHKSRDKLRLKTKKSKIAEKF